jgi:hypothetical protein
MLCPALAPVLRVQLKKLMTTHDMANMELPPIVISALRCGGEGFIGLLGSVHASACNAVVASRA